MKILHTSDWHLGRSLYDKKRYEEFDAFLDWLTEFIQKEKIDVLLVAGDIFDSSVPGNRAQAQYYGFLAGLRNTCCRHVVITGGNHDSPTFLDAPGQLLGALGIKVVGAAGNDPAEEIYTALDQHGNKEAIICAVPFLRDRDIRTVGSDESIEDKSRKLREGIVKHYGEVYHEALKYKPVKAKIPLIGMGHLFTEQGRTVEGDGVRDLYIGTLVHIDSKDISEGFDYMALGHLHSAQAAGGYNHVRYSGSPLPMGFAEADHVKKVIVVEFKDNLLQGISEHEVPRFQELVRLSGNMEEIAEGISELRAKGSRAWLEVEVSARVTPSDIRVWLAGLLEDSSIEILRIKNRNVVEKALTPLSENESLETINDKDVFLRCLDTHGVQPDEHEELIKTYDEAIQIMNSADPNAN